MNKLAQTLVCILLAGLPAAAADCKIGPDKITSDCEGEIIGDSLSKPEFDFFVTLNVGDQLNVDLTAGSAFAQKYDLFLFTAGAKSTREGEKMRTSTSNVDPATLKSKATIQLDVATPGDYLLVARFRDVGVRAYIKLSIKKAQTAAGLTCSRGPVSTTYSADGSLKSIRVSDTLICDNKCPPPVDPAVVKTLTRAFDLNATVLICLTDKKAVDSITLQR